MKRKSKNKKLTLILVLVLLISVGYAALASNLKINGSSKVNAAKWNVYWDNIQITEGSVPADNDHKARITDNAKTQVEFSVELSEPGDFYEFTVDAVNNGTIDAMIEENGIVDGVYSDSNYTQTATLPDAVSYTVTYADGTAIQDKHLLAKKSGNTATRETYKVRIEYKNDDSVDPEDLDNNNDHTYYFKFSVNYVQADGTAIDKNASAITYVTRQNEGQITPGDVVRIGDTEEFYVVSGSAQKTVLLAKYNLLVGNIAEGYTIVGQVQPTDPGYGLQSADAIAGPSSKGMVAFSSTNYWDDTEGNLLSPYNANGASYSGNPYPYVYDSNSNIYQYISGNGGYVDKLKEMGAPSTITGRLLSYEEADASKEVGRVDIDDNHYRSIIFNDQFYWFGSAESSYNLWIYGVHLIHGMWNIQWLDYGATDPETGDAPLYNGVRPVIEIPTSELN